MLFTGDRVETGPAGEMFTEANLARVFDLDGRPQAAGA